MYTAWLARLHALGNISTSRLTAPSLALSPPQFMRVGAVAVGLGPLRLRVETAAVAIMACVGMTHPAREPPSC